MPTRPNQVHPDQAASWARHRKNVGQNIRRIRVEKELTQESLALESGVTRNVLIQVEHGRRGLLFERLFDIAEALGVPATDLMQAPE